MSYWEFFGLTRDPFGSTPDPAMFYKTLGHEDCFERLKLAIQLQRGLSVIIGDVGYGKTTIKVALIQELLAGGAHEIGVVNNPRDCRTDVQFLRAVLGQFGLESESRTALDLTTEFLRYLEAMHLAKRKVLLIIDEGQNLSGSHLEILRTFLSFETPTEKLINIAIFAQPELEEKIRRKRNLAQRVTMDHKLNPLNRKDTGGLIAHRLMLSRPAPAAASPSESANDAQIYPILSHFGPLNASIKYTESAIDVIHERSAGIPRLITNFCADCLIEAAFLRRHDIDAALAGEVIGRRVFTGADEGGRPVRQIQTTLGIGETADGLVSLDDARERRRAR